MRPHFFHGATVSVNKHTDGQLKTDSSPPLVDCLPVNVTGESAWIGCELGLEGQPPEGQSAAGFQFNVLVYKLERPHQDPNELDADQRRQAADKSPVRSLKLSGSGGHASGQERDRRPAAAAASELRESRVLWANLSSSRLDEPLFELANLRPATHYSLEIFPLEPRTLQAPLLVSLTTGERSSEANQPAELGATSGQVLLPAGSNSERAHWTVANNSPAGAPQATPADSSEATPTIGRVSEPQGAQLLASALISTRSTNGGRGLGQQQQGPLGKRPAVGQRVAQLEPAASGQWSSWPLVSLVASLFGLPAGGSGAGGQPEEQEGGLAHGGQVRAASGASRQQQQARQRGKNGAAQRVPLSSTGWLLGAHQSGPLLAGLSVLGLASLVALLVLLHRFAGRHLGGGRTAAGWPPASSKQGPGRKGSSEADSGPPPDGKAAACSSPSSNASDQDSQQSTAKTVASQPQSQGDTSDEQRALQAGRKLRPEGGERASSSELAGAPLFLAPSKQGGGGPSALICGPSLQLGAHLGERRAASSSQQALNSFQLAAVGPPALLMRPNGLGQPQQQFATMRLVHKLAGQQQPLGDFGAPLGDFGAPLQLGQRATNHNHDRPPEAGLHQRAAAPLHLLELQRDEPSTSAGNLRQTGAVSRSRSSVCFEPAPCGSASSAGQARPRLFLAHEGQAAPEGDHPLLGAARFAHLSGPRNTRSPSPAEGRLSALASQQETPPPGQLISDANFLLAAKGSQTEAAAQLLFQLDQRQQQQQQQQLQMHQLETAYCAAAQADNSAGSPDYSARPAAADKLSRTTLNRLVGAHWAANQWDLNSNSNSNSNAAHLVSSLDNRSNTIDERPTRQTHLHSLMSSATGTTDESNSTTNGQDSHLGQPSGALFAPGQSVSQECADVLDFIELLPPPGNHGPTPESYLLADEHNLLGLSQVGGAEYCDGGTPTLNTNRQTNTMLSSNSLRDHTIPSSSSAISQSPSQQGLPNEQLFRLHHHHHHHQQHLAHHHHHHHHLEQPMILHNSNHDNLATNVSPNSNQLTLSDPDGGSSTPFDESLANVPNHLCHMRVQENGDTSFQRQTNSSRAKKSHLPKGRKDKKDNPLAPSAQDSISTNL